MVPDEGITRIIKFMDLIGYCKKEYIGMSATEMHVRLSPTEIKAEMEGLRWDLSAQEWYMAGVLSKNYANAINQYKNKPEAPPPYGFDAEENERLKKLFLEKKGGKE